MLIGLLASVGSVGLGTGLAFLPGSGRVLGPIRTFALTAALAVVLVHLLPEGIEHLGWWAVPALIVGFLVPRGLQALLSRRANGVGVWSLELSFVGLLIHRVLDGVSIGAVADAPRGGVDVALALSAHTVPVVALVVLTYLGERGRRVALTHALLLAVAGGVGVLLGGRALGIVEQTAWISPFVGGLLLHVVSHTKIGEFPRTWLWRVADLAAAAAGFSLPFLFHHH